MALYPRPGPISNRELLKQDAIFDLKSLNSELELKDNLLEHHDYVGVHKKVYDILAKWYGADFEICRALRPDPFHNNKPYLELYPSKYASSLQQIANLFFLTEIRNGLRSNPKSFDASIGLDHSKMISNIINSNLSYF